MPAIVGPRGAARPSNGQARPDGRRRHDHRACRHRPRHRDLGVHAAGRSLLCGAWNAGLRSEDSRSGTSIGPNCRVGGEVEASILLAHVNKYRRWLPGRMPTSANGSTSGRGRRTAIAQRLWRSACDGEWAVVSTGRGKVGCFLGDHTKTGLGTLLNTGTNAGAFCNLLPGGLLPRAVPSFTTCQEGQLLDHGDLDSALEIAAKVMARRGAELTPAHVACYRVLFAETGSHGDGRGAGSRGGDDGWRGENGVVAMVRPRKKRKLSPKVSQLVAQVMDVFGFLVMEHGFVAQELGRASRRVGTKFLLAHRLPSVSSTKPTAYPRSGLDISKAKSG